MIDQLVAQRNGIEREIERQSVALVKKWLLDNQLTEIAVDDEHEQPSYAQDFDDDDLDCAIGWLPIRLFHNPTHPAWNPVIRMRELDESLAATPQEESPASADQPSTVWLEFNDAGSARWSGFSDDELDRISAFLDAIKRPDTIC